ncbi:LexA family protein [Halomonas alkaliantarctica]|uniref:LexA family protein n=1 Tax=Halomonas alkaliantarctica TaxID=232346 RepID=UPI00265A9DCB|nr:S24 family peptidase [Halomonas alkaliantarctica]
MPTPSNTTQPSLFQKTANAPSQLFPTPRTTRRNTYALRVQGNRMHSYNLFDGDIVIIRCHQQGSHQETAIAIINQQEIVLKQLSISRLGVHLWPADTTIPDVFLRNGDIQALGMVMGVERHTNQSQHH